MHTQPEPLPEHTVEDLARVLTLLGFTVQIWDDESQIALEKNHGLAANEQGASDD